MNHKKSLIPKSKILTTLQTNYMVAEKKTRPLEGTYRAMNEGTVAIMVLDDESIENLTNDIQEEAEDYTNCCDNLPPEVALVGYSGADPKMLDEALQGPNAKEWQNANTKSISLKNFKLGL